MPPQLRATNPRDAFRNSYEHISRSIRIESDASDVVSRPQAMCTCVQSCGACCQNVIDDVECDESCCTIGRGCGNRWEAVDNVAVDVVGYTDTYHALVSEQPIEMGTVVIEYTGEILTIGMCEERYRDCPELRSYVVECGDGYVIDALYKGNFSRFINHSCSPNLDVVKITQYGLPRVFFVARFSFDIGEELTFDYGPIPFQCQCWECMGYTPASRDFSDQYDWDY
jgi:[histone H3]-lysine4 N-trimethyltransferase ASH1L